jgi:hypothetical protein
MSRERWGTFSVKDHTEEQPFATDVLMYDRLVLPKPSGEAERSRWSSEGWNPDRLDEILEVLKADKEDGHAVTVEWNKSTRNLFEQRIETMKIVYEEYNAFRATSQLLATDLLPAAPKRGVTRVAMVAAYPSVADAQKEWIPNPEQQRGETLTLALAHQIEVPKPEGKNYLELLDEAVGVASDSEFRTKRAQLYEWQEKVVRDGIPDADALNEMAQFVDEYNAAAKKAKGEVYTKFAFTLVPVVATAFAGPITPAVGAGAIANLVRFWIFDRKPVIKAGESQAAAMFHTVQQELGWRLAFDTPQERSVQPWWRRWFGG